MMIRQCCSIPPSEEELARSLGAPCSSCSASSSRCCSSGTLGKAASGLLSPGDITMLLGLLVLGYPADPERLHLHRRRARALAAVPRQRMTVAGVRRQPLRLSPPPVFQTFGPGGDLCRGLQHLGVAMGLPATRRAQTRFERRSDIARVAPGQFQTSADGRRVFFIRKASSAPETGASSAGEGRSVFILDDRADRK